MTIADQVDALYKQENVDGCPEKEEFADQVAEEFTITQNAKEYARAEDHNSEISEWKSSRGMGFWKDSSEDHLFKFKDCSWRTWQSGVLTSEEAQQLVEESIQIKLEYAKLHGRNLEEVDFN